MNAIAIGIVHNGILMKSPLVRFVGACTGFFASAISWVPSFFIGGIVFGKFQFAKDVYHLHMYSSFDTSMAHVFFSIPLGMFLMRIPARYITPLMFWTAVTFSVFCFSVVAEHLIRFPNNYAFASDFIVIGVIFFIIMKKN